MATTKKTTTKKSSGSEPDKPKAPPKPKFLNLAEAAEFLGISEQELTLSRYRGIAPGKLATKKDGQLVWERKALESHKK